MHRIGYYALTLLAGAILATPVRAEFRPAGPAVAERYVAEALSHNLALQGRTLDVEQARAKLAEARGAWQPRLDFVARYSRADGGRTIDIPTGDMLNGVYSTLNDYLRSQGQAAAFPQISNQSISFLRDREQETKLRLTQPIWRPEISRGIDAARAAAGGREAQLGAYRRELRLAVLTAYHTYLEAELAVEILASSEKVTAEALRVNRVLFENDKVTEDRVLRAEADDLAIQQQHAEAERDRNSARAYFNFLLNRPLTAPIDRAPDEELRAQAATLLADAATDGMTPDRREELFALQQGVKATSAGEAAARARSYPTLSLAVESGLQGTDYRTGGDAKFVQGSLVAEFNIWDGRQNHNQLEQARIDRRKAELQLSEAREQLALQVQQAGDEFRATVAAYRAADRRAEAASRAFDLVSQRERQGLVNQLSFLDARNELTRAALNRAITEQRLFIAAAGLDRAAALSPLP